MRVEKYVLSLFLYTVSLTVSAQEYWSGTNSTNAAISRTGQTKIGSINIRSSGTGTTTVMEHTAATGDFYIRSVATGVTGDIGNLILNDGGGNIGIGTAKPMGVLHIAQPNLTEVPRASVVLSRYWSTEADTRASAIFHYEENTQDKLVFAVSGLGGDRSTPVALSQAKMVIQANGNVGIGTTSPKTKLAVKGVVQATEVNVTNATDDWPDYVFDSSYQLPPLEIVKEHIKSKKHLPGIPTAKEIKEKGIDIGRMFNQQQRKIEEMMLYILQQNGHIKSLEAAVQSLKKSKMPDNEAN